MSDLYAKRVFFLTLMLVSAISGGLFFVTNTLDFIIAAVDQGKFHLPNISYAVSRVIGGILLPVLCIVPLNIPFAKVKGTKILFIAYGVFQLLTVAWIFYFLRYNPATDLLDSSKIVAFQSNGRNAFVSSYVFWDTYSWIGTIYTIIYSALCIYTGISFDDNRKKVRLSMLLVLLLRWFLPLVSNIIVGKGLWSSFWLINNYLDLISCIAYVAAICIVAVNDDTWVNIIWEQHVFEHDIQDKISSDLPEVKNNRA